MEDIGPSVRLDHLGRTIVGVLHDYRDALIWTDGEGAIGYIDLIEPGWHRFGDEDA